MCEIEIVIPRACAEEQRPMSTGRQHARHLLFRRLVNFTVAAEASELAVRQHFCDGSSEGGLAVIDVTVDKVRTLGTQVRIPNRAHVQVGLLTLKSRMADLHYVATRLISRKNAHSNHYEQRTAVHLMTPAHHKKEGSEHTINAVHRLSEERPQTPFRNRCKNKYAVARMKK